MTKFPVVVFDVNETLLDLETMSPIFERIFRERLAMRLWFSNLILYSEALTLAQAYVPFTEISAAVLQMLADTRRIEITASDKKELLDRFSTMPAYPEVPGALSKLRRAGYRLVTLTNNLAEVQSRQLQQAGIVEHFDRCFSVHEVRRHKPAPEVYALIQRRLGVAASDLLLVASHAWDTLGAAAAGWGAALIKRPGNDVLSVGPQPIIVGLDLEDVANQIIGRFATQQE
jgi:2-haloacid dehalogenase